MFLLIKPPKTIMYCTFKISAENVSQLKCDGVVFRLAVPVSESSCDEHRGWGLSPPRTIKYRNYNKKTAFYVTIITFIWKPEQLKVWKQNRYDFQENINFFYLQL